ncbi:MAG: ABC transporter permease [Thermodesulfobacteriota bacterium]
MKFKRLWAIFKARNLEFFRDRSALGWNFVFPFLIVAGFGVIFGGKGYTEYKVGLAPYSGRIESGSSVDIPSDFKELRYTEFVGFQTLEEGLETLRHHKIDLLIRIDATPFQYWVDDTSPKGYILEKAFRGSFAEMTDDLPASRMEFKGKRIRYIDWLFPGILSMNMMFSALWGVGYIVVRYRKNGVLKRLKATPLTAFEYLTAQVLSRIFLLMFTLTVVWAGCHLIFSFEVAGFYLDLFAVFFVGGLSMSAMGLLVASRGTSEEFADGVLNFITWPMMFLSEVWFSIESAPRWIKTFAQTFPLTHMLKAARMIMNDGASLRDVSLEIGILLSIALVCLTLGASLFSWNK